MRQRRFDDAVSRYSDLMRHHPGDLWTWLGQVSAMECAGDLDGATRLLEEAEAWSLMMLVSAFLGVERIRAALPAQHNVEAAIGEGHVLGHAPVEVLAGLGHLAVHLDHRLGQRLAERRRDARVAAHARPGRAPGTASRNIGAKCATLHRTKPMSSILTNTGAMVALQTLKSTNANLFLFKRFIGFSRNRANTLQKANESAQQILLMINAKMKEQQQ